MPRLAVLVLTTDELIKALGLNASIDVIHAYMDSDRTTVKIVVRDASLPEVQNVQAMTPSEPTIFSTLPTVNTGELPKAPISSGGK